MDKNLIAIGLMSGTSMDGVDASIIRSDGEGYVDIIGDLYLKYDSELKNSLHCFCNKINSLQGQYNKTRDSIGNVHKQFDLKRDQEFENLFGDGK